VYRVTGGRLGLWRPKANRWGTLRLTCMGRRTGQQRSVILGYFEDGPNLVTMAMNGWGDGEPAWWLNLRAPGRQDRFRRRAAAGHSPRRNGRRTGDCGPAGATLTPMDAYAALRSSETAVVVLEPRAEHVG
jgi:hypothetical protein